MRDTYFECKDFLWDKIQQIDYKPISDGQTPTFNNVMRQNIFEGSEHVPFDIRYFECEKDGFSALEKHDHVHVVIVLRGKGVIIVGKEIHEVCPYDLIVIPAWAEHQLINTGEEPFGFLCTVNIQRDNPQMLSKEEVNELCKNSNIKNRIQIPTGYYNVKR